MLLLRAAAAVVLAARVRSQGVDDGGSSWESVDDGGSSWECRVRNCRTCRVSDPHECAECWPGHRLGADGSCEACGPGCAACTATRCLQCSRGYRLVEDRCEACPRLCARCDSKKLCRECLLHARLADEGCVLAWERLLTAVSVALGAILFARRKRRPAPCTHREFVGVDDAASAKYPCGSWKGFYTKKGEQHAVIEFDLVFEANGLVRGGGVDDVGRFAIRGLHANTKVAFTKTYESASENDAGVRARGNRGHAVEYRATPASGSTDDLGAGLVGNWSIPAYPRHAGAFRLWPVALDAPAASTAPAQGDCAICFEPNLLARLHPCGHAAFCRPCLDRLPEPRRCPFCRTHIDHVLSTGALPSAAPAAS